MNFVTVNVATILLILITNFLNFIIAACSTRPFTHEMLCNEKISLKQ